MFPRKRLDIGWTDLCAALAACALPRPRERLLREIEQRFAAPGAGALCCLSVRSALDLLLDALALPPGSEVLMSALTIPDMARVVERHGLVAVPIDVEARTLAPALEAVAAAGGQRTRALLIAHLFGTRIELAPYAALARERGWLLIEDAAQALGVEGVPHPAADVALFSFGPIKTRTALGGAVARVRDGAVLARMRGQQAAQPLQPRAELARRVVKYAGLLALGWPPLYARFAARCARRGRDLDALIQGSVRGFAGGDLFAKLRRRPSTPLVALLHRRLASDLAAALRAREERARFLIRALGTGLPLPGDRAPAHSHWVFTLESDDPARTVRALRAAGFDATHVATMAAIPAPADRPHLEPRTARALLGRLVYVPCYAGMPDAALERLAALLRAEIGKPGRAESQAVVASALPAPERRTSEPRT